MTTDIDPLQDGVTHIWLSPEGNTNLGRALYIGAHRPFVDPVYGRFASIIAFWTWYDSGRQEGLRDIHQDNMIRSSMSGIGDLPGNRAEVMEVLKRSILNDKVLSDALRASSLPFLTYEVINFQGREGPTVYPLHDREWYVVAIEAVRKELQA